MGNVVFRKASCIYEGADRPAVDALDLEVRDGELLVLVGPSGCGKSTALRMIAGLEPVDSGQILIGGVDVTGRPPAQRDIAMVFQNYALYPHMTVAENMGFSLKLAGLGAHERMERVREAARMLDLEACLDRKPKALSGGQRQRVAMGRAIVRKPRVFLMDEPLSNLDAKLRSQTRIEIASLQARLGVTTVYVTHDQVEAMTLGHRVAVLDGGVLQQCDPPRVMYDRPRNTFVAGFIGSPAMNLHSAPIEQRGARFGGARVPLREDVLAAVQRAGLSTVVLGIRPESFEILDGQAPGIALTVDAVEALGADAFVYGHVRQAEGTAKMVVRVDGRAAPRPGESLTVEVRAGEVHAFHPRTGERLG
jgi:multiple sugar transport system ATP-binding protein